MHPPFSAPVLLAAALGCAAVTAHASGAGSHDRELVLAGGSLHVCSSLSPRDCREDAAVTGAGLRRAPRYHVDAAGIDDLGTLRLQTRGAFESAMRAAWIDGARTVLGKDPVPRARLVDALRATCVQGSQAFACPPGGTSPWERMDDASREAVLSAFEVPQLDAAGMRLRERASLDGSRDDAGPSILRAFVERAAARAPGTRPRIAVVTASAGDPFDPVDVYLDALREAGADTEWWPLDAALASAVRDGLDCDVLPALRRSVLQQAGRERVFPDLAAQQQAACRDPAALAALPDRVQGVFFSGGDQWRLRRAFVDADGTPDPWLQSLRAAVARGDVVVAGTSAGSAVQSAGPMVSNGDPAHAVRHGARRADPPAPGCTRAGSCGPLDEDALTYSPGGLALAPGLVVDTHFSERARELRLLELLAATGHARGIGIDETSALHLRWRGDALELRALGAHGGWAMDASPGCTGPRRTAHARYLAPGTTWRWSADGAWSRSGATPSGARAGGSAQADHTPRAADPTPGPGDALADGAMRAAAQALARGAPATTLQAAGREVRLAAAPAAQEASADEAGGPGGLRIDVAPARGCSAR